MQEWRDHGITEVDNPGKNGARKSQKTIREGGKTQKVIRLIKKEVYKALELEEEDGKNKPTKPKYEPVDKALVKHDILKHVHFYKMAHNEQSESFITSFFREHPNLKRYYSTEDILDMLIEIGAETTNS